MTEGADGHFPGNTLDSVLEQGLGGTFRVPG